MKIFAISDWGHFEEMKFNGKIKESISKMYSELHGNACSPKYLYKRLTSNIMPVQFIQCCQIQSLLCRLFCKTSDRILSNSCSFLVHFALRSTQIRESGFKKSEIE